MGYKEELAKKIDSEAAFHDLTYKFGESESVGARWITASELTIGGSAINNRPWWLVREVHRIVQGVYKTTEIIDAINRSWANQFALHISSEDDKMVAYTPSHDDGQRDKQIKTTMGKFLRRHFLTLSDAQIQNLEQMHYAELTGEFLLAQTRDEIRHVYRNMVGDSGCMRHAPEYFGIGNDIHPSAVYEAPGMGVAYTKTPDGNIASRAVVWVNPADPTDKRYVRVYGAPLLKKLLERADYKCASLKGALLRKIPFVHIDNGPVDNTYVVPYLDGPAGDQSTYDGAYVVDEGGDFLRVISGKERMRVVDATGCERYTPLAKTTGARVQCERMPEAEFTSELSGTKFSMFDAKAAYFLKSDGTVGKCAESEKPTGHGTYNTLLEGQIVKVFCPTDTPSFYSPRNYRVWVDTESNKIYNGFRQLSRQFYEGAPWVHSSESVVLTVDGAAHAIRTADRRIAVPAVGEDYFVHISQVPALRKSGYINCSPINECPTIIHKDRPTMHRTKGGTVFDEHLHAGRFVKVITGEWMLKSQTTYGRLFGVTFRYPRSLVSTWIKSVATADVIDAFKSTDYGSRIGRVMADLSPDGLTVEAVEQLKKYVHDMASAALYNYDVPSWNILTDDRGVKTLGSMTYDNMGWPYAKTMLEFVRGLDSEAKEASGIQLFLLMTGAVDDYISPYLATLDALIEQKKLEAAGQLRLDAPVVAPAAQEVAAVSDERFAIAA